MSLLLLDEMFSGIIAEQLRAKGHDVLAAVADPALVGLADDQILAHAAAARRALVTANIKDFIPLDARYRAASQTHAGLILVSAKTFPQDRTFTAAIISALSALLDQPSQIQPGQVLFLPAGNPRVVRIQGKRSRILSAAPLTGTSERSALRCQRWPGAHHRPRGKGGALPGRVLLMCNTTTPLGSGRPRLPVGRP